MKNRSLALVFLFCTLNSIQAMDTKKESQNTQPSKPSNNSPGSNKNEKSDYPPKKRFKSNPKKEQPGMSKLHHTPS